jgi:hypothetical protein
MTHRIVLDFIQVQRWRWFGPLFLLVSCAVAAVVFFEWSAVRQSNVVLAESIAQSDAVQKREALARLAAQSQPDPQAQLRRQTEIAIAEKLDYSWNRIFGDMEQASSDKVAVLGFSHDQSTQGVRLVVEALGLPEIIDMVDRLNGDQPPLWYLGNYQLQTQKSPSTIHGEIIKKTPK